MARISTPELQQNLGAALRRLRIELQLTQSDLAQRADIGVSTVVGLERGTGSITSLVRVLRALDRSDWLDELSPEIESSPMELLRAARGRPRTPQRVRNRRPNN